MKKSELEEDLADYAHVAWSGWMVHLFSKSTTTLDSDVVIPSALVARWVRQVATPYQELSEGEKESDRAEARKILEIVWGYRFRQLDEALARAERAERLVLYWATENGETLDAIQEYRERYGGDDD
jgi:hypothetical protein